MNHQVSSDSFRKLLSITLEDMANAPMVYRPTNFWTVCSKEIIEDLSQNDLTRFRRTRSALRYYVPAYSSSYNNEWLPFISAFLNLLPFWAGRQIRQSALDRFTGRTAARTDYNTFLAADKQDVAPELRGISESRFGSPIDQFQFDGRNYSKPLLNYLRGLAFLKKEVDTSNIRTVLELGGGFGTLGEILLKCPGEEYFYIDVDIPPLCALATTYLREQFGYESIVDYEATRGCDKLNIAHLAERYRAAVLCPWQLPALTGSVDLFVNFVSFQEMEPAIVRNYARYLNAHVDRYILLRNSRTGKEVSKAGSLGVMEPVTRKHYTKYFDKFELVAEDAQTFGETDEARGSESLLMIFERKDRRPST